MKKFVDISGSERVTNMRLRVKKEGHLAVITKTWSHLCDKHKRRYDKKLLLESPRGQFTKLSPKIRLIFAFFWNFSAHKTWNQKISTATGRPDSGHCYLAVKSSGASISGSSGVVKCSDNFEVNLLIFWDFQFWGSWYFQCQDFLTSEIERNASWKTKKKKSFIFLSLRCILSPGEAFFRKNEKFWTHKWSIYPNPKKSRLRWWFCIDSD